MNWYTHKPYPTTKVVIHCRHTQVWHYFRSYTKSTFVSKALYYVCPLLSCQILSSTLALSLYGKPKRKPRHLRGFLFVLFALFLGTKSNVPLNRSNLRSDAFLSHWYVYIFKAKIILRTQSRCFLEVYSRLVPTISRIVINVDTEFHHADITKTITNNDPLISIGCQTLIVMLLLQEVHNQTISSRRCATA